MKKDIIALALITYTLALTHKLQLASENGDHVDELIYKESSDGWETANRVLNTWPKFKITYAHKHQMKLSFNIFERIFEGEENVPMNTMFNFMNLAIEETKHGIKSKKKKYLLGEITDIYNNLSSLFDPDMERMDEIELAAKVYDSWYPQIVKL